jgi:hypothetical protein
METTEIYWNICVRSFAEISIPSYAISVDIKADSLTTNGRRLFTSAFPFMVNGVSTGGGKEQQSWAIAPQFTAFHNSHMTRSL